MVLLRALRQGASENDEIVCIDDNTRAAIRQVKENLTEQLGELRDKELRLALLAEVVDEFLVNYRKKESVAPKQPRQQKTVGQIAPLMEGD